MAWSEREREEGERLLRWGLQEDLGEAGDITSAAVIDAERRSTADLVARQAGIVAGLDALPILVRLYGKGLVIDQMRGDGSVAKGEVLARLSGPTRTVLAVERTMLNFVCHLSGVATLTGHFVRAAHGTIAKICDTRKTTPGWRYLEKYAVRVGGGTNHRVGLFDAVLIKDNHLADLGRQFARPVAEGVRRARLMYARGTIVEVEIDALAQLPEALAAGPDMVLLDNMSVEEMRQAVEERNRLAPEILLEASGGVNLATVRAIAETGVDRISVGGLTHSAPILDLALDDVAS